MFDIGFSELVVILIIALFVFGPQKLPQIARFIAKVINKLKYETDNVKKVIEKEIMEEDLVKTDKFHKPDYNVYQRLNKNRTAKKENRGKNSKRDQGEKNKTDNISKLATRKPKKRIKGKQQSKK
jgi:Tat protein translocase TatB subunit